MSTALANLALVCFIFFALLSNKWLQGFGAIVKNPLIQSSIGLFIVLCLSVGWSDAGSNVALQWVSKYKKLLVIPLAMPFFQAYEHKRFFLKGLLISLLMGVLISYANYFGLSRIGDCPDVGCSTHSHITLSMLNCLLFLLAIGLSFSAKTSVEKRFFYVVSVLSAINVAWVLQSRTGQLMILSLIVFLPFFLLDSRGLEVQRKRWYGFLIAASVVSILSAGIFLKKESRFVDSIQKVSERKVDSFKSTDSAVSVDVRFEFYRKSLSLIAEKPLLGWGAGGQEPELRRLSEQGSNFYERIVFSNPHNEYLTWAVQTGLLGLACFLYWLFTVWRHALRIEDPAHKLIMLGWLLIFTLGNFLNSFLLDFSEGYMTVLLIAVLMPFQSQRPCSTEEK
jgi:O-antigen ligase